MKNQNSNPIYIWERLLPVQDAHKALYFGGGVREEDESKSVPEHPTRCLKARFLSRRLGIRHELGVIVLRGIVLIQHRGAKVWTRYTDGAAIQRAVDGRKGVTNDMFALWPPCGTRSHKERKTALGKGKQPSRPPRSVARNNKRLSTLKDMLAEGGS
jgi:hypothetical protein